jgi:hypothetical protein
MQKLFWWYCRQNKQQADYKKNFTQVPLVKNLVDTLKTMFPYLSVDLVWLLQISKEGHGFQRWHKNFSLGQQITKTIVINVGSKEREDEETTRSFDNGVSFEGDDWIDIEDYVRSEINLEEELSQDERKPAAIPNKNPSVKPSAIAHRKQSAIPAAIPHKKSSSIPQENRKNDDDIAEDKRKSAAIGQEEMLTTHGTAQSIQLSIPFLLPIAGKEVTWICEFCDSQWPQSQKRCGTCKRWKGGKRSLSKKRTIRNKLCLRTRRRKGVEKVKCCLLLQPRRLMFLW